MSMFWSKLKCKECGDVIEPSDKEGLTKLEIMMFVSEHLASCYDFFELTRKIQITEKEEEK